VAVPEAMRPAAAKQKAVLVVGTLTWLAVLRKVDPRVRYHKSTLLAAGAHPTRMATTGSGRPMMKRIGQRGEKLVN